MRTMACVWVSVIVLITINEVFGGDAFSKKTSCNACIRSGGSWCKNKVDQRCVGLMEDNWCAGGREILADRRTDVSGDLVNPRFAERTLFIDTADILDITYPGPTVLKPNMSIINTTQSSNIGIEFIENRCRGPKSKCTLSVKAVPNTNFCLSDGQPEEYVFVTLKLGSFEEVLVKYSVDCACPCSLNAIPDAVVCHRHGDYACGVCTCHTGWTGEFCGTPSSCPKQRGDISDQCNNVNTMGDTVTCSGNGHCGECGTCICDTKAVGAQYFNEHNYCEDLCLRINDCDVCFNITDNAYCEKCEMSFQKYDEAATHVRDRENLTMWVPCAVTVHDCNINYMAMVDDNRGTHVMIVNTCNDVEAGGLVTNTKVPLILGILAGVAVIAAVAGVMIWKHMNAVPPLPLNDPHYTNIGAEDCTGENPLYKPPTSSFKNPTYGKW